MTIAKDKVVSMHFDMSVKGEVLDSSKGNEPLSFIVGAGQMLPSLEAALLGKEQGTECVIDLKASEAFGEYNPEAIQSIPLSSFGDAEVKEGMQFHGGNEHGEQIILVKEVKGDEVLVDANHPLAGKDLSFNVDIIEVRDATAEELSHGHVHAAGGCGSEGHDHEHGEGGCCGGGEGKKEHSHEGCCGGKGHKDETETCCGGH